VLATAPRPGLVLAGVCPPLRPAEAAALQTAWLKRVCTELPGIAVFLFGRPTDALPMLRYFAGPGVELREWPAEVAGAEPREAMAAVARLLFAEGHTPVLVRTPDVPDADEAGVLACAAAAARGDLVLAEDQRGEPWLYAVPDPGLAGAAVAARRAGAARGPWARSVQDPDDLALLLHERHPRRGPAPALPVRDVQAALRFYETVFATELLARDEESATVMAHGITLQFARRGPDHRPNGLRIRTGDLEAAAARPIAHGCVGAGDGIAPRVGGGIDFTVTDPDGNRLCFWNASGPP
jgi:predicted enzyme related to lactoylglutathione lyase